MRLQPISLNIWKQKYKYANENFEETFERVAYTLFDKDEEAKEAFEMMCNFNFMFAGRVLYGVGTGRKSVTYSNCYVIPIQKDSLEAILKAEADAAFTMKSGGGCGYNFSVLRPKGAIIQSSGEPSSGAVSFIHSFDAKAEVIKAGGNRRAANIGVLDIWHPDIEEFIEAKRTGKLQNFNLSIGMLDSFMEAVEKDEKWDLIFPDYERFKEEYEYEWDGNIQEWLSRGYGIKVYKTVRARDLYEKIMRSNYEYAEPGILFLDTVNNGNPLNYAEFIHSTNPCGEVPLPPYGSCNLGMVNLATLVENPFTDKAKLNLDLLKKSVEYLVKGLDKVLDINYYPIPEQREEVELKRQIGIGITGLADMLVMMGLKYGSEEGRKFAEDIMRVITNTAYKTSALIAKEKGSFPLFEEEKYLSHPFIQQLDDDTKEYIRQYGLRNCRLISIAPTGTTSLLMNNVSSGIEPIFELEYIRKVRQPDGSTKEEVIMDYAWMLYKEIFGDHCQPSEVFQTVKDLAVMDHVLMQAGIQKWVDNSISKTINIPVDYDYEDFKKVYEVAWKVGLKGCTTYRPNNILGSVLSTDKAMKEKKEKVLLEPEEIDVGPVVPGMSYEIVGHRGESNWITVNTDDYGNPMQIFIMLPKESGMDDEGNFSPKLYFDRLSDTNFIARLISLALRHGIPVEKIIKQAHKASYNAFNLAFKIRNILMDFVDPESDNAKEELEDLLVCPECGGRMVMEAGCSKCIDCGYSKCG